MQLWFSRQSNQMFEPLGVTQTLLKALALHDRPTADHCRSVADLALDLARHLGLPADQVALIGCGALLHDLGKLGVPPHVLNKADPLTDAEWTLIHRHPDWGADLVAPWPQCGAVAAIVRAHHERWDGAGYPQGLRGEAIPFAARIVTLVDAFSAMIEPRPYGRLRTPDEALDELTRHAGTQFDPALTALFCAFWSAVPGRTPLIKAQTIRAYDHAAD